MLLTLSSTSLPLSLTWLTLSKRDWHCRPCDWHCLNMTDIIVHVIDSVSIWLTFSSTWLTLSQYDRHYRQLDWYFLNITGIVVNVRKVSGDIFVRGTDSVIFPHFLIQLSLCNYVPQTKFVWHIVFAPFLLLLLSFFLPPKVYPTHFSATTERKSMKLHRNVKHYE